MRILVVSAHSADFCSRAGGTICKYSQAGDSVRILSLCYGERSESGGLYANGAKPSLDQVRAIRHQEAVEAAGILGADIVFKDWGDLSFHYTTERAREVAQDIRAFAPDVILTHHGPDPRSVDHDTTYRLVMRAAQMAGAPGLESALAPVRRAQVFLFEATIPLTELEGFNPDIYLDVTDVWSIKVKALQAFARAQGFLEGWYTDVAKRRGFQAQRLSGQTGIEYAEAFERTSPWVGDRLPVCE